MQKFSSWEELASEARGKWPYILQDLTNDALGDALHSPGNHVGCPVHGGSDGFRLFKDFAETGGGVCNTCGPFPTGFLILKWLKNYTSKDAFREVAMWLKGEEYTPTIVHRKPIVSKPKMDPAKAALKIALAWQGSKAISGTAAERFLEKRGILRENIPRILRFHPGLNYWSAAENKSYGEHPCMLAPITDKNGAVINLHRTFLTEDGDKAAVPDARLTMSKAHHPLNGGAIKLFPVTDEVVLGLGEGIETSLSAYTVARIPVWSCVNTTLLGCVEVPASVRHIVIFGDLDRKGGGQKAANEAAERFIQMGKTVEVLFPSGPIPDGQKSVDWNDVLNIKGIAGFPDRWQNCRSLSVA